MIWLAIAASLVLWLAGAAFRVGGWANMFLLVAAALLAYQVLEERRTRRRDR